MQALSVWFWLAAFAVAFVPVWMLVRYHRRVDAKWLFLVVILCLGFINCLVDLAQAMPSTLAELRNVAAHDPLVAAGLVVLVMTALYLWAIVAYFQDRTVFGAAHAALWGLALLIPFLVILAAAPATVATLLPDAGVAKSIASLFSVSLRVKDTPVE